MFRISAKIQSHLAANLVKSLSAKYSKIILELGIDDGRLLEKLAKQDKDDNSIYIGIEIDKQNYEIAKSRIKLDNVVLLNGSFVDFIPAFPDNSLDRVIAVLPCPNFVDEDNQQDWEPFYKTVFLKMKIYGTFQLVTEMVVIDKQKYEIAKSRIKLEDNNNAVLSGKSFEEITDELLQPISDNEYNKWGEWLTTTFQSIGFELVDKKEDAPEEYQTRYIYRFKRNPKRIRIISLIFVKNK
jgi:phospholipid N-methyltransferase